MEMLLAIGYGELPIARSCLFVRAYYPTEIGYISVKLTVTARRFPRGKVYFLQFVLSRYYS